MTTNTQPTKKKLRKYLTLQEALMQPKTANLWVINNSHNSELKLSGEIIIPIVDHAGRTAPLTIKRTWLPTNLINEMERETILDSHEFRKHWNAKLIRIVTDEYANTLLKDPEARFEANRLQNKRNRDREEQSRGLAGSGVNIDGDIHSNTRSNELASDEYSKGISFAFKTWTDNLQARAQEDTLSEFRSRKRFTTAELKFLRKQLSDKPKIVSYVNKELDRKAARRKAKR